MRGTWTAGAAIVALLASVQAGQAEKAASDQTSAPQAPATVSQQQYDELSKRVTAVEGELQQQEARGAADHQKVEAWKAPSGWWDNTSISGLMFWDITDIDAKRNGTTQSSNGVSFDLKRFYVGVDHKFNDTFAANITTDVTYDSNLGVSQVFVKNAYLQAKLDPAFIVRVGSAAMPWLPYAESIYGYRFVENTLADRLKMANSADWGVHVLGDLAGGIVSYEFSAVNGGGFKKTVRSKSPDYEGRISLNYEGLQLGVGGYSGKLGAQNGTVTYHTAQRFDVIGAYTFGGLKVGLEYYVADNWTQVTSTTSSHASGYSPFASYRFDPQWSVFARYDYAKPYSDVARSAYHNDYYNIGVDYQPVKIVDLALVYKHDSGSNGFYADSNGTIGGTAFAAGNSGTYNEIGIWGQVKW